MYLSFYKLKEKPFEISTDPKFLWLGEKHREALSILKYGIIQNKGFLLLTGDVGTGKTTLINELLNSLGDDVIAATITDPGLERLDLFKFIAHELHMDRSFTGKVDFILDLKEFLDKSYAAGKKVLLIIDEAQRLSPELFEEIRVLSNIEKQHTKLINIFFIGQDELNEILSKPVNRALRQRITINFHLSSLSPEETESYVRYRLEAAGGERNPFTRDAVREIYSCSQGLPRRINVLCDHAMLTGYVKSRKKIGGDIIRECFEELELPLPVNRTESAPVVIAAYPARSKRKTVWAAVFAGLLIAAISVAILQHSETAGLKKLFLGAGESIKEGVGNVKSWVNADANNSQVKENSPFLRFPIQPASDGSDSKMVQAGSELSSDVVSPPSLPKVEAAADGGSIENSFAKIPSDGSAAAVTPIPDENVVIYFAYNSQDLSAEAQNALDNLYRVTSQHPECRLIVSGYTDEAGHHGYNLKLSEFRAIVAKTYLVGKGLDPSKIEAIGRGPAVKDQNPEQASKKQSKRRVEIEIVTSKK